MQLNINGNPVRIDHPCSVAKLIEKRNVPTQGTAVAVNGILVPRGRWELHNLEEGDNVTIISAAYGG